ncbi:MAG: PAS domain S-box protein, partial [Desulfobacteraceae bacterium]|nr:PAS domain S-box protein [Desulfobacteraceae bacterium]
FKQNGKVIITDISVIPVSDSNTDETSFLILFEKPELPQASEISNIAQKEHADDELSYLKQELQLTKEHLQSIIEEKDEVNQELWSANEEVQSTNEELQSVNEEMEAAKEELESTNEELLALNEELQTKNIELTASKEFAVNLLETANTIVLTLDSNAMITTFNRYAEELTGYKKEDVIGKNWFDIFIPPEDQKQVSRVINSALKHIPEASLNENCIVVKSGMERMISWHNNVLRDGAGKVIGLLSVGMDITEHKLAEEALKEAYEINKMIISESPIGIAIYDESGQCISANKSIGEIIGTTTEQVLKQNYNEIKSWKESGLFNTAKDAVKEGITQRREVQITSSFEKVLSIDCYFVPFQEKGKTNLMFMITDISAHKQAEIEKIKAQQYAAGQEKQALVGQVAGKIAHDFNNILGVIMGNAELSLMECDDLEIKKTLELIFEQTIQGKNLTKNLVAFAKDQELKQEFFNINKKINLVLDLLKRDIKKVEVVKDFEADLPNLLADSGMIEHAIVNLIQNSIHALGKADCPRIFIRTYCIDDSWVEENYIEENICIEIEDNGCGIPEEHLDNIYLPSFTLKGNKDIVGSYAKNVKGTGYGMSNIKKYVEQHKGTIAVESEFGTGTKFSICLPVTKKELTKKEKEEISKLKSQFGKNILLVEDEPAIADIQHRILTHKPCNHKVDIANDGNLAIELLKQNNYDFISLDYVLPGNVNGMDVYNYIRETDKIIPILFISGNIEFLESIKELKQKDTNIDHLSKPCQNKEYLSSINELLERTMAYNNS